MGLDDGKNDDHNVDGTPKVGKVTAWMRSHLARPFAYPRPTHTNDERPADDASGETFARWLDT